MQSTSYPSITICKKNTSEWTWSNTPWTFVQEICVSFWGYPRPLTHTWVSTSLIKYKVYDPHISTLSMHGYNYVGRSNIRTCTCVQVMYMYILYNVHVLALLTIVCCNIATQMSLQLPKLISRLHNCLLWPELQLLQMQSVPNCQSLMNQLYIIIM